MATNDIVETADKRQSKVQNQQQKPNNIYKIKIIYKVMDLDISFSDTCTYPFLNERQKKKEVILYDNEPCDYPKYFKDSDIIKLFFEYLNELKCKFENRYINFRYATKDRVEYKISSEEYNLDNIFIKKPEIFSTIYNDINQIFSRFSKFQKIIDDISKIIDDISSINNVIEGCIINITQTEPTVSEYNWENSFYACYDSNPRNTSLETDSNPTPTSQTETTTKKEQQSKRIKLED
jgi:hypothetical protein